jgi:hypothetical protein
MSLERCPYCPERVRKGALELHLKRCIRARRAKANAPGVPNIPEVIEKKKRGRPRKT